MNEGPVDEIAGDVLVAGRYRLLEPIGEFRFSADEAHSVEISNAGTDGHVIVDVVQLVPSDR
jgi:hypothetical protein